MSEFYFKDLSVRQSVSIIDPNFSMEDVKKHPFYRKVFLGIRYFKDDWDNKITPGKVRFHLVGHECRDPRKQPSAFDIGELIQEKNFTNCSMLEFLWFCIHNLPEIDRPYRTFEVVTLGVMKISDNDIVSCPMISSSHCVTDFMGGIGLFTSLERFPRKSLALAIEKL